MEAKTALTNYLTTFEIAHFLSISLDHARHSMRTGKIKATNSGRLRATEKSLMEYFNSKYKHD